MASKPVQEEAIAYFGANPTLFGGAPTISTTVTVSSFSRIGISKAIDPVIAFSSFKFNEGKRTTALDAWKNSASEIQKDEPEVLGHGVYADKVDDTLVKTIEIYSNGTSYESIHAKRTGLREKREYFEVLKLAGGYLRKGKTEANL